MTVQDRQRWRCPAVLRVKSAVLAAVGVAVAVVFFPLWLAVPLAVALAAAGAGMAVLGSSVLLDRDAGTVALRAGFITRRVRLTDVSAVLVDRNKVSVARAQGTEISLYAWRKSLLDGWLRVPVQTSDIGHAIASAVALAQQPEAASAEDAASASGAAGPRVRAGRETSAQTRSALAAALLGCAGAVAVVAALFVRVSWHNPVMTALGAILALGLGVCGVSYLLFSVWLLLTRLAARHAQAQASAR